MTEECPFCKTRTVLKAIMDTIEQDIPAIGSDLYDDKIAEIFNACDDALSMYRDYCDELPDAPRA